MARLVFRKKHGRSKQAQAADKTQECTDRLEEGIGGLRERVTVLEEPSIADFAGEEKNCQEEIAELRNQVSSLKESLLDAFAFIKEMKETNADKVTGEVEGTREAEQCVEGQEMRGHKDPTMIAELRNEISSLHQATSHYFASGHCISGQLTRAKFPKHGHAARHVKERILQAHELDNKPRLNTSSYVNVVLEPEEEDVALLGLQVNLADGAVYESSVRLHDTVVNMIAQLWHAPKPDNEGGDFSGAGTVGSTEACLLAGLALKFRWRKWYAAKNRLDHEKVLGIVPNVVISTCYQAAWEKFFKYFDVTPRFVKPSLVNKMRMDPKGVAEKCDERTIAVVGILGNHYNGAYDPIWEINDVVEEVNKKNGWQIGIHVDAASGGFVAPFQEGMPAWDFRLKNVLTISASGHKFGESACGTGWLVFRHLEDLADHVAISVTYLGGVSDSFTLNFSRPATAVYVQYYKFLRLGLEGYKKKVAHQMVVAKHIRENFRNIKIHGQNRFEILDADDEYSLPVVAARLNPKLGLPYNDIDLQHALSEYHWYVSGYNLSFDDPSKGGILDTLVTDEEASGTMFRVVVKANLGLYLAEDLEAKTAGVLPRLDELLGQKKAVKVYRETVRRASIRRSRKGLIRVESVKGTGAVC